MVLKTTRVRVYACDAGIKKSPIVKTGRRPTERALGAPEARRARADDGRGEASARGTT